MAAAYYATLADLITSLEDAQQAGRLSHRLRTLVFPSLMIIEEIGYLPISRTGAMLLSNPQPPVLDGRAGRRPEPLAPGAGHPPSVQFWSTKVCNSDRR